MLKSIRQFDKKTREGILSEIALELGRPSLEGAYSLDYFFSEDEFVGQNPTALLYILNNIWNDPDDIRLRTVEEIIKRLNLKDTDHFQKAKSKLLEFVGREIRGLALESGHISNVRKRLGQKGILSPGAYQVKFAEDYSKLCEPFGITKNEVRQAIEAPDMFEHFIPEIKINNTFEALSLYVKTYTKKIEPYSVLVDTRRLGDELFVHFALRIFHSDVDVSDVTKPTELLKIFTDKFGSEISIEGQTGKLILYKTLNAGVINLSTLANRQNCIVRLSHRKLANDKVEVSIAYGVDVSLYADSLRSHGIQIRDLK